MGNSCYKDSAGRDKCTEMRYAVSFSNIRSLSATSDETNSDDEIKSPMHLVRTRPTEPNKKGRALHHEDHSRAQFGFAEKKPVTT